MSHPSVALSAEEIQQRLHGLPHWQIQNHALERHYQASSYLEGLSRLNTIAQLSEAADHHPELILKWRQLTVRFWTHTAQGVTELDFKLAQQTEQALEDDAPTRLAP